MRSAPGREPGHRSHSACTVGAFAGHILAGFLTEDTLITADLSSLSRDWGRHRSRLVG